MEQNVFRDYCKAENTEDEEDNIDLQSRLYAEVYYASSSVEGIDTKPNIKLENSTVDKDELRESVNINSTNVSGANYVSTTYNTNIQKPYFTSCSTSHSNLIEDDKSHVRSTCSLNEVEILCELKKNKSVGTVPCKETSIQYSQENSDVLKDKTQSVACLKVEVTENTTNVENSYNTSESLVVKSEIEESKENLKLLQSLDSNTNTTQPSTSNNETFNVDNTNERVNEINIKPEGEIGILQKYEFSKIFINRLYLEKYENLIQTLVEEEQKNLREKEKRRYIEEQSKEVVSDNRFSTDDTTMDSRYKIKSKKAKNQGTSAHEGVTLLSSDLESDSEESILEVPIPPKPQPPVIKLKDSDESSETSSSDSDTDEDCLPLAENENNTTKGNTYKTLATDRDIDTDLEIINSADETITHIPEDIILNCTNVQRNASSINEIMKMSKNVQSARHSNDENSYCEKSKSVTVSEVHEKNVTKSSKSNSSEFQLPLNIGNKNNLVYERDKDKSASSTQNTIMTNHNNPKESHSTRKRRWDDVNEPSSTKQRRIEGNGNKQSEMSSECHNNKDKNKDKPESWEDYFFRPMSQNLKAYYDESRGQENFDIEEIQSKMSKDPRLWAILDEDLMPGVSRQRFWNVTCNNCNRKGHQKYNCPEPRKPPRCHMCGTEGHVESRCPQKMCLTCGKKQGTFRKTCEFCRTLYCDMCKAVGHKSNECPDLWRRFHQTTRNTEINIPENLSEVMKPADLLYCCNCTKRGHDSFACNEYRWSRHFPTPAHVSNYGESRPQCNRTTPLNITDVIPFNESKKKVLKNLLFPEGEDNLQNVNILYSYGTFSTKKANGEEVQTELTKFTVSHMTNFLKGRIVPAYLDQLSKTIKFEIKIYRNFRKGLVLRVRSIIGVASILHEFFLFWLQLNDEDKKLEVQTDFPRSSKKMANLLMTTLQQLFQRNDTQDPRAICFKIQSLQSLMSNAKDPAVISNISKQIIKLRSSLTKIFLGHPKMGSGINKLYKLAKALQLAPPSQISIPQYMDVIATYNKLFMPRQLTEKNLRRSLRRFYKNEKKKLKVIENKKEKKKQTPDFYQKFVKELQKFNQSKPNIEQKQKCDNKSNTASNSLKMTQKHDKQIPATASTSSESLSTVKSVQSNPNILISNTDNTFTERNDVAQFNNTFSVQSLQALFNQDAPKTVDTQVNNQQANVVIRNTFKIMSPNLSSVPIQTGSNVPPSNQLLNNKFNFDNDKNLDKIQTNTYNKETSGTSNTKQDYNESNVDINATKAKKSKKAKKKTDFENNLLIVINNDKSVENRAKKLINEARQFKLPYMNNAVDEVQKRINDKSIKQEHIDVLQKLVDLEKNHQKYVTSICGYLK